MPPPINAPELFADIDFPVFGLDLAAEFDVQRPQTTPIGSNVRAYEPGTLRGRGGQRAGLSKYLPAQVVPGTNTLIQHLNVIVDPTTAALLSDDDNPSTDYVDDPSTSNRSRRMPVGTIRRVRRGGSGRQPNRNRPALQVLQAVVAVSLGIDTEGHGGALFELSINGAMVFSIQSQDFVGGIGPTYLRSLATIPGMVNGIPDDMNNSGQGPITLPRSGFIIPGTNTYAMDVTPIGFNNFFGVVSFYRVQRTGGLWVATDVLDDNVDAFFGPASASGTFTI